MVAIFWEIFLFQVIFQAYFIVHYVPMKIKISYSVFFSMNCKLLIAFKFDILDGRPNVRLKFAFIFFWSKEGKIRLASLTSAIVTAIILETQSRGTWDTEGSSSQV